MRAIDSRSTTMRLDEEFAVAVAAGDGRGECRNHRAAERCDEDGDVGADGVMNRWIAHDTLLEVAALRDLELRLYQRKQVRARRREPERGGQHVLEGDEADV